MRWHRVVFRRMAHTPALYLAGVWLVFAAFSSGCGIAADSGDGTIRLIDDVPAEFLTEGKLLSAEVVFDWQFGRSLERPQPGLDGWQVNSGEVDRRMTPEGMYLESGETRILLERDLDVSAEQIDAVRVTTRGIRKNLRLQWRGAGERFARGGFVVASVKDGEVMPTGHRRVTMSMRAAPGWSGDMGGLRLVLPVENNQPIVVKRIEALSYTSSAERVAAAAARAWKLDVDHEVRDVRLGLPGLPLTWPVESLSAGVLRFGYALIGRPHTSCEFKVSERSESGETSVLWTDRLDPVDDPTCFGVWHDAEVDLRDIGNRNAEIVFEVRTDEQFDPVDGWVVWSSPTVVVPDTDHSRPNIVFISIDTLRSDRLSLYGYRRKTSPFLDAWAQENAVVFENAVAQSPWTLPSHASMFTGVNVTRHGISHTDTTALARMDTMAGRFRDVGYTTFAVTGGGYVHPRYGFANGFDQYRYWTPDDAPPEDEFRAGVDRVIRQLRVTPRPFFLFLHTFAVHGPYRSRQPFYSRLNPDLDPPDGTVNPTDSGFVIDLEDGSDPVPFNDVQVASAMYDAGIAYVDDVMHDLFLYLDESDLLPRTIVVVTSDHGEGLGEQGVTGHGYLKENNVLVPLLIAVPGRPGAGSRVTSQVRSIDILPSLLDIAGLRPAEDIDGTSFLPLVNDSTTVHPETAMSYAIARKGGVGLRYQGQLKYVFNNSAFEPLRGQEALFDIVADPAETENRIDENSDAQMLRSEARTLLEEQSGLWMQCANPGSEPVVGWIRGPLIHPEGVKSFDLQCPCVTQARKDELHFVVPAGARYTLVFERVVAGDVEVEVTSSAASGGRPFSTTFDPAMLGTGLSVTVDDGRWLATDRGEAPHGIVTIFWRGDPAARVAESPPIVDSSLVDQLRALGYVE